LTRKLTYRRNTENKRCIEAHADHTFTHATFNDDGSILYAWQFGRPDDCLYVWRIDQATGDLILPADSEGSYESVSMPTKSFLSMLMTVQKQQGRSDTSLIPYNSYLGCIMHSPGDVFFPAQIRSTQRENRTTLPKMTSTIPKAVAACMYGDHSLLVVEKGVLHTRIWEHPIVGGANHVIDNTTKERVINWKFPAEKVTQMKVVTVPNSEHLVILLCTRENNFIFIPVMAK
jgi:hypothetical protein